MLVDTSRMSVMDISRFIYLKQKTNSNTKNTNDKTVRIWRKLEEIIYGGSDR